ncbi:type 1 glutamine amidotransferase [Psychromarinibacter sp. S121]|uniref:type 1 glutamine amidotransferase n=1 Tax=Psychromarinibacter sp. S121 TaxID=3415127 RepID=UPI003C7A4928
MAHFVILQHEPTAHLALFAPMIADAGHRMTVVMLGQDELPPLDDVDALWILGGAMDVFQEDIHPWLIDEKRFIREAVRDRALPAFGICLGHQLMAEALGGSCALGGAEIGVLDVKVTAPSPFLTDLPPAFPVLIWHGVEVTSLPPGATCVAKSDDCAVHAIQYGPRAFSMQSHPEVGPDVVADWAAIPAAAIVLAEKLGPGGAERLTADVADRMPELERNARTLFDNWCRQVGIASEVPA